MFSVASHTGIVVFLLVTGAIAWIFDKAIARGSHEAMRRRNQGWMRAPMDPLPEPERNERVKRDVVRLQTLGNILFLSGAALAVLLAWRVLL